MPVYVVELLMVGTGAGLGLTMSPATNAIMNAVPREKAGAGSAVNNTVRQVAGALGVAILGSILAVTFRAHLGADTPQQLADRLDRPAAVSQLPASARVGSFVESDTSQSIGNALPFAGEAQAALQQRAKGGASKSELAQDLQAVGGFVTSARSSFMSAMNLTSALAGLLVLLGAVVAWRFLPNRKEFDRLNGPSSGRPAEPAAAEAHAPQHLDADAMPVPAHVEHEPRHAQNAPART